MSEEADPESKMQSERLSPQEAILLSMLRAEQSLVITLEDGESTTCECYAYLEHQVIIQICTIILLDEVQMEYSEN
jgi:hypothetical protein